METREPPIATLPRSAPSPDVGHGDADGFARQAQRRGRRLALLLWGALVVLLFALSP